jgi:dTDP-4-dehydrorhamnose 3,5-epimerase
VKIETTDIDGMLVIEPRRHGDHRGFFSETFRHDQLREHGVDLDWIQDNHAYSTLRGVIRGLHFQAPPFAQAKLLRVTRGAILDVAVDIRRGSTTFGRHVAVELSADNWRQLLVPAGFAHGYCTLTDESEVLYKVTAPYDPASEGGLLWNDPSLGIPWPIPASDAIMTDRDKAWPILAELQSPFF